MRKISWLLALTVLVHGRVQAAAQPDDLGPVAMDSYRQTILVTFKSEAAARRAHLRIAPLYHDLRAAFSTRMDDCNLNDLRVAEVMTKYGQKGTFTLNDPRSWWQDNPDTGVRVSRDQWLEIPRRLLNGGNSIGGHSLNHEMMPALSKNNAFREIMGVRVALEVTAASPVNTFVYPFVFYQSALRDGDDRADLDEMLRRAGYYQLAEHRYNEDWDSGLQDGLFVILDGSSNEGSYSESILTQVRGEAERPLFLVTMHAWVNQWGGPEFPLLAEFYRKWSGRTDWWYCNQNQYAAYRYQALHSRLHTSVEGNVLRAVLTRPDPLDLNDWVPLTLKLEGVEPGEVAAVDSPGAEIKSVVLSGAYAFDLFHARERGEIATYAEASNSGNSDRLEEVGTGQDSLRALLYRRGDALTLTLRNEGTQTLRDMRVIFRLPLRWSEGAIRKRVADLAAGASATVTISLTGRADAGHYSDGSEYDVAQVDYVGERRVRLYATCKAPDDEPAAFFARNGFWILGPLPGDLAGFDPRVFAQPFLEGKPPQNKYAVPWGEDLAWRALPPVKAAILDPDIIPTSGKSNVLQFYKGDDALYFPHAKIHYLLYGQIESPTDQIVRAVFQSEGVKGLSLNGQKVEGRKLALRKGTNDLRILYAPVPGIGSTFDESNYGCYFRLVDDAGKRVAGVRFVRPSTP